MSSPKPRKPRKLWKRRMSKREDRKSTLVQSFTTKWLSNHIYETRSKSTRIIETQTLMSEPSTLSRRSSKSSVICLGSFRKVPELVNLEDSSDDCEIVKMATLAQSEIKKWNQNVR
nr:uncharacterized protein LOC117225310 [Megalopta genalis]